MSFDPTRDFATSAAGESRPIVRNAETRKTEVDVKINRLQKELFDKEPKYKQSKRNSLLRGLRKAFQYLGKFTFYPILRSKVNAVVLGYVFRIKAYRDILSAKASFKLVSDEEKEKVKIYQSSGGFRLPEGHDYLTYNVHQGTGKGKGTVSVEYSELYSQQAADELDKDPRIDSSKIAILDFACQEMAEGDDRPGGAWETRGSPAQEEALAQNSTLMELLDPRRNASLAEKVKDEEGNFPRKYIPDKGVIYVPGVRFRKDGEINEESPKYNVIAAAAPNLSRVGFDRKSFMNNEGRIDAKKAFEYDKQLIKTAILAAVENDNRYLILGAIGTGVFANPPVLVALAQAEAIMEFQENDSRDIKIIMALGKGDAAETFKGFMQENLQGGRVEIPLDE